MQSFLEYASHKKFDENLELLDNLLTETGIEGITLVQNEIESLMLNEGLFDKVRGAFGFGPKVTDNVKMNMPTGKAGGYLGVKSNMPDNRSEIDVAKKALIKIRDTFGPHHTIKVGNVKTSLEGWLNNLLQNLTRIKNILPGPEANQTKATQFRNQQAQAVSQKPTDTEELEKKKKFRGTPADTQFFRDIGATNRSNQWSPEFGG